MRTPRRIALTLLTFQAIATQACYAPPNDPAGSNGSAAMTTAGASSSGKPGATTSSGASSSSGGVASNTATPILDGTCTIPIFDAGPGVSACRGAAAYVTCSYPGGGECGGLSDDPTTQSDCGATAGRCQNVCTSSEYAVACGTIGPGGNSQWFPDNCTPALITPAGIGFACCPCE